MKKVCALMVILLLSGAVWAEEPTASPAGMPEMGAPKEMKQLASFEGSWDIVMQHRQMPEQPWEESKASCTYEYILGGAAMRQHFSGNMLGMPFKGESTFCFHRDNKKWQVTWLDDMFGALSYYEGKWDGEKFVAGNKEIWQGVEYHSKMTYFNITNDKFEWLMEMSTDDGNTWFATMKSVSTRK